MVFDGSEQSCPNYDIRNGNLNRDYQKWIKLDNESLLNTQSFQKKMLLYMWKRLLCC